MGDQVCHADARLLFETSHDFARAAPALSWARDEAEMMHFRDLLRRGVHQSGIPASQLGLIVVASSRYLHIADIVYRLPLAQCDELPRLHSLKECRPRALQASTHGAEVSAYIALLQNRDQAPLQPWRKGTWLARTTFRLTIGQTEASIFRPEPLTDTDREEMNLGKETVRYFYLGESRSLPSIRRDRTARLLRG